MSTRCIIRTKTLTRAVYVHFDGYPAAVLPRLAARVMDQGPEAALAEVFGHDWDDLFAEVVADEAGGPMVTDPAEIPSYARWVYDVSQEGVRWWHPCTEVDGCQGWDGEAFWNDPSLFDWPDPANTWVIPGPEC